MKYDADTDLGYTFHPGSSLLGDEQIDIILREKPTNVHFDPQRVQVTVRAPIEVEMLNIHHPWRFQKPVQVSPGFIRIFDRVKKEIEVFTFGGKMEVTAVADYTLCQISSPAPLLELRVKDAVTTLFFDEIEIIFAEMRAKLNLHTSSKFDAKLMTIEPFLLYVVCLECTRKKLGDFHNFEDVTQNKLKHKLLEEKERLQATNEWPSDIPTLQELLTTS